MSKKLLIVESPAKAKTISKYIGDDFTVKASVGHIRDLPKSNKNAVDVKAGFIPNYIVSPGKEKVVNEIKNLAKKSDSVVLATDPDREGEAIAWHLSELLQDVNKNIERITYNEITKEAVTEAIKHPRKIDVNLKTAQEARRVLDRLFGYDLSGLIWKKVRYGLSAGRVQSPALRILMEREREIRAFKPETFWTITADVEKSDHIFMLTCAEEPTTRKRVDFILEEGRKEAWKVDQIKETKAKRAPRPPFITSTLQQSASNRYGFSPSRTMGIAQKLYEAGEITYMRTDSLNLSQTAIAASMKEIASVFGKEYFKERHYKTRSKNAQEAHEAIRPTNLSKKEAGRTAEQKRLYRLIRQRTLASQMADAEVLRTKISVKVGENKEMPLFNVNGSRIVFPGWLKADPEARGEDVEVPKIKEGDTLKLKEIKEEEKQTQPPNRYSEAGLVKELEKRDIGRPSTYASIIKTLEDRGYVTKEGRTLFPTDTGDVVSSFLEKYFDKYISDSFTAEMENELDEMAEGKREYKKTLSDFYGPFTKDIEDKEDIPKITDLGKADPKFKCPKCGSSMVIKLGRGGKFLSCSKYPDCEGSLTLEGKEVKGDEPIGTDPETGKNVFVKVGRFGPYVQLGEKEKGTKPKMASIPKEKDIEEVTLEDALKYLELPKDLGDGITVSVGRFGPYVHQNGEYRSIKSPDDVYTITKERALELLAEEKALPKGVEKVRVIGTNTKTKKEIVLYKSKNGPFLRKGLRRIYLDEKDAAKLDIEKAIEMLKG
ncbi:MAG: type I DNA topoisomerase [Candidatus Pacebacteria bacterium]|nr:type I DNA topoisomerase [Candidatus Paceibacterota bacterium]